MSSSSYDLDQVVVYDFYLDRAFWMTPAESRRYCSVNIAELIDESDPHWKVFAKMAGPKPLRRFVSIEKPQE